jgi:hypothetical protein
VSPVVSVTFAVPVCGLRGDIVNVGWRLIWAVQVGNNELVRKRVIINIRGIFLRKRPLENMIKNSLTIYITFIEPHVKGSKVLDGNGHL